ncbi:Sulfate and thiosulfate binding protein CysP [Lysobacter dokdonensis DS-58]|uniref:Sulfate and thiosulfate binding protein CysP n=2 Tax=Noviluteimonas TaxID=3382693 RepID=A0A0A2WIG3_9GAMM|nr:sulfate ABC transporter substrate-binding protein [Lysobacter dokdonensis]KGQ18502.1 Sulfate and thiosulfate binding protein CysP [Lysobacter dokdonensis DS-58]
MKPFLATFALVLLAGTASARTTLLNVSYDPTRELYEDVNVAFAAQWKKQTGEDLNLRTSHGGSGKQARAVIEGLGADVVTLALAADIDAIAQKAKLLPANWQSRLPYNSAPYTSTIVFLVRKGNPKKIRNWNDLARPGVAVITPNPKTSGGARWNYLAAWAWASREYRDGGKVVDYMAKLFRNVPVLDTGARGATTTFVERGMGDVLIAWENEALLATNDAQTRGKFDIVVPSLSIKAEPPVAWVDKNVDKHGTRQQAEAYLRFLYTPQGQQIVANHFYRPALPKGLPRAALARFPKVPMVTIDTAFGGWANAQKTHFTDGGFFDRIYKPGR